MADYLAVNNRSSLGKISISRKVFEQVAEHAAKSVRGVSLYEKKDRFKTVKPVQVYFHRDGKVDVLIRVCLESGTNSVEVSKNIQNEVSLQLQAITESIPFRVEIEISEIVRKSK